MFTYKLQCRNVIPISNNFVAILYLSWKTRSKIVYLFQKPVSIRQVCKKCPNINTILNHVSPFGNELSSTYIALILFGKNDDTLVNIIIITVIINNSNWIHTRCKEIIVRIIIYSRSYHHTIRLHIYIVKVNKCMYCF